MDHFQNAAIKAGIYPSHIGFEVFASKDNWTYSRSWMGELSPYYQTGVKVTYSFTEQLSAELHLLNGWQIIGDNNRSKSVGTQVAWNTRHLSLSWNTFGGPELPRDDRHWRLFSDLIALFRPTSSLGLGMAVDLGLQQQPNGPPAKWQGAALFARHALSESVALAARAEVFRDAEGVMSGAAQTLAEGTVTLELRPADALIVKLEARADRSTAAVFSGRRLLNDGSVSKQMSQLILLVGAVAKF